MAIEPLDDAALDWPDVVAVAVPMHTAMRLAEDVVVRTRTRRGDSVRIVLYGLYAPLCDEMEGAVVDHRVGGEFEAELVRIADGAPTGRTVVLDRLQFPVPARDVLPPLSRYARLLVDGESRVAGYTEATRGCVHRCRHCPVPAVYDGRIRVVQRDVVVADVAQQVAMGARHITFGDPDFLNAVPHALAVIRAAHERCPEVTFDITTKVEHILEHASIWPELRELGVLFVVSAVESLSPTVLRILDKGHTAADAVAAVRLLRAVGIEVRPSLLPFTPWSGLGDYLELLDFIDGNDLVDSVDPVQLSIRLLVPRGSLLLEVEEMREHLDGYDPATLSWRWRHPEASMDGFQRAIAAMVASDADGSADPRTTHRRIRRQAEEAAAAAGVVWRDHGLPDSLGPASRPRLSEAWFCCAEPTEGQLRGAVPAALSPSR
jgi:hypothetical protein